ncbi:helix-turn-helix domain-containing protein [Cohnella sp. JJ-181]|uniref:helix-turn-helix domain-containing protein n=1 Tax=Cohnella rhizoplanae TaxID=2974897 RepID=UPI0022FF4FD7|nr:AraC family transcriptional regulator [Cohnella sp. JJ-181]CAI6083721.1 HTH-type transcriptional activator RhaS [Cohnella sp. JJ-181]
MSYVVHDQLRIAVLNVTKVQYKSRIIFDYVQSCYTVSYIQKGEVITTLDDKEFVARTGDVMIHRPHKPFNVISQTDGVHYLFNVDVKVKGEQDFFDVFPLGKVVKVRDPDLYEKKFDELRSLWLQENDDFRTVQTGFLAFFLLHEILESTKLGERRSSRDPMITDRFNNALHYIENGLEQDITREDLAQLYHMNPVYFSRAFQKIYGITPMKMLKKMRLQKAKQMLENTEYTIDHIAQQSGHYDAAHFSRAFQKTFGQAPTEYRKSIKLTKRSIVPTWFDYQI